MWLDAVDAYRHITPATLKAALPRCPDPERWARAFDDAIEFFGVRDVAMLLAQVGHESADLTRLEESLYYTARRMTQVWPARFMPPREQYPEGPEGDRQRKADGIRLAQPYARNPQALANNVYSSRMGNGPPESGDGWSFRGQGPIQLTGKANYTRLAIALDDDAPLKTPSLLQEPTYGALSACWYYVTHVPAGADIVTATERINGGRHGLADRRQRYERIKRMI